MCVCVCHMYHDMTSVRQRTQTHVLLQLTAQELPEGHTLRLSSGVIKVQVFVDNEAKYFIYLRLFTVA